MAGEERIAAGGENIRDDELCFLGRGEELELYRALRAELLSRWPNTELRPRRTQTGFAERYIYAVASPGTRRIKGAPEHYVLLSVVLPEPSGSARVAVIAEASPHRFTHHIVIGSAEDIDGEAMGLAALSHAFALERGGGR